MSIDNNTGKTKGFYERGQAIFDRIPGMPEEKNMKPNSRRRTVAKLEDLREWLLDRIDGSEETRGEDSLISGFISQIDALSSEMGTIPSDPAATPVTDAVVKMMEAGWLSLGSSAPGAVKPLIETMELMERELIDLKQRLLPQYLGRAERAEHERDALLEQLIGAEKRLASAEAEVKAWIQTWKKQK